MKHDNGGPAFPRPDGQLTTGTPGMSLRDWFAGQAIQGLLASGPHDCTYDELSIEAFDVAEKMIENKQKMKTEDRAEQINQVRLALFTTTRLLESMQGTIRKHLGEAGRETELRDFEWLLANADRFCEAIKG